MSVRVAHKPGTTRRKLGNRDESCHLMLEPKMTSRYRYDV